MAFRVHIVVTDSIKVDNYRTDVMGVITGREGNFYGLKLTLGI